MERTHISMRSGGDRVEEKDSCLAAQEQWDVESGRYVVGVG